MKLTLLPVALLGLAAIGRAQFYAPETEFHDPTQRFFPVEAARVLAWSRNLGQTKIAEVDFKVEVTSDRETVWTIRWKDAAGKPVREKTVRYAETALSGGPEFYRSVFAQLTGDDWSIPSAPPDNASTAFWQGGELAGVTRLEALKAAASVLKDRPKVARPADAMRLAGILTHASLARYGTQVSLDSLLLARAAAWLCTSERLSREKFDGAWASVLFLSSRVEQSRALWAVVPKRSAERQTSAERFWEMALTNPQPEDRFKFAARVSNRAFAMPAILLPGGKGPDYRGVAGDLVEELVGRAMVDRVSEFAPPLMPAGTRFAMDAPARFLAVWESAVEEFVPAELDYVGYRDVAAKARSARKPEEKPPVVVPRLAPVLNLGLEEGSGALIPTASITARDLLGYGWEMTGTMFGQLNQALKAKPDEADPLAKVVLVAVKGVAPHFDGYPSAAGSKDSVRLQLVATPAVHHTLRSHLPPAWKGSPDSYLRRVWLTPVATRSAFEWMIAAGATEELVQQTAARLASETGTRGLYMIALSSESGSAALADSPTPSVPETPSGLKETIRAAIAADASTSAPETDDFTKFKTADEFWAAIKKLRETPGRKNTPEEYRGVIQKWLQRQKDYADAFEKAYPQDARRYAARLIAIDVQIQLAQLKAPKAGMPSKNALEEIIAAPDADETAKGEAAFFELMIDSRDVAVSSPHTVPPFLQGLVSYVEKYPKHERAPYVTNLMFQLLNNVETPSTDALLKKLTTHSNPELASAAKALNDRREQTASLKKNPLELKFTAMDGSTLDFAKLRGKVVLLDFWASWCTPCMADAPHVVATYKKLQERGFEIVGVSLDEDKAGAEAAMKSHGMTWPQHFDGKGWKNELAQRFGIRSIPATWLFDKKGKLREIGLRGPELEARVERLLEE